MRPSTNPTTVNVGSNPGGTLVTVPPSTTTTTLIVPASGPGPGPGILRAPARGF